MRTPKAASHIERSVPPAPSPLAGTAPLNPATYRLLVRLTLRDARHHAVAVWGVVGVEICTALLVGGFAWLQGEPDPLGGAAVWSLTMVAAMLPMTVVAQGLNFAGWARRGWLVGYFTDRSTQLVHPEDGAWVLTDHLTRHPGKGQAGPFRRAVFSHLASEADRHRVAITMETTAPRLASLYMAEMPGLEIVGTYRQYGRTVQTLRREPQ